MKNNYSYKITHLSEFAFLVTFEAIIDEHLNEYILYLAKQIRKNPFVGLQEIVEGYNSLSIYINVLEIFKQKNNFEYFFQNFQKNIQNFIQTHPPIDLYEKKRIIEVPVTYDGEDIEEVATHCGLSRREVIEIHTSSLYRVYMMGFLPGFVYLGGLDSRLYIPRKKTPRLVVPAGSVGLAGSQTGIYPFDSPGGWQLIGKTEVKLFTKNDKKPTLFTHADVLKFVEK